MARSVRACALAAHLLAFVPLAAAAGDEGARPPAFGEELEVVGERRPGAAADTTAAATVVDAHRFEGEARSVAELIATAPGVAVSQYGGLGQLTTVSLRGSSAAQVQVLLDGLPLNTAAGGGVDLARIPRAWIERIEVVRGAEGAVYGAGTLGGVVNIVTRRAAAGAWSAEATAGSFRTFAGSADGAVGGERWGLLGAAAVEDTSGRFDYLFDPKPAVPGNALEPRERTHDAAFTAGGLAKLWAAVGEGRLDAVLQLSGGTRDLPGSPYQLTPRDGQRDARAGLVTHLAEPLGEGLVLVLGLDGRDDRLTVWLEPFPTARQRDLAGEASAELRWTAGPSELALRAAGGGER
ncbi:MAG TPA: TonB-dependent receptor plug domain-containing protein, partial [Polyangia bacterium]